ncbi:unnamed protein product [Fusarium equiseti]|uniref:LysM domain-containing protein n=1 Tax=Fusarium equiseti TaxID=61235 RepID=A0A8J2NFI6_FUSEQ|nr:unnamed protein product [Fusarium equiseti]
MILSRCIVRFALLLLTSNDLVSSKPALAVRHSRGFISRRQDLPDGVPRDCTFLDAPASEDEDCADLADRWDITSEVFLKWNPSLDNDCGGVKVEGSYCVERNWGIAPEPSTTTTEKAKPTSTQPSNGIETPSPLQPDIVDNCNKFYPVKKGEDCAVVSSKNGIKQAELKQWNPLIGEKCTGLWANAYACVSVIGHKPSPTKPTTTTPATTNGIETPSPIQDNMISDCNKFHLVKSTTTCLSIEAYYNVPLTTFYEWNPSVREDCTALITNYWVCVGIKGWTPAATTISTRTTTTQTTGIATPAPIQDKMVKNCNKFHKTKSTTTCLSIEEYYGLPVDTFISWNPSVGRGCTSLLVNYWVCVSVPGWEPPTKTITKPIASPMNGIPTPAAIQEGMIAAWNPKVGLKCTGLWTNYNQWYHNAIPDPDWIDEELQEVLSCAVNYDL